MKPFAVLDAGTRDPRDLRHRDGAGEDPGVLALRRRGGPLEQAPYRWGQQDPVAGSMNAAEFIGKQLVGKKAQYAGDTAMHDKTRVFGLVRSEVIDIDFFDEAGQEVRRQGRAQRELQLPGHDGRRRSGRSRKRTRRPRSPS